MIRKRGLKSLYTEPLHDKRALSWLPLAPPDFAIDPDCLLNSFVEREVVYYGTLNNVSSDLNLVKRMEILRLIDSGLISKQLVTDNFAIISICAQDITVSTRSVQEMVIIRIPTEEIVSVAYIRDNLRHYVVFLHGSPSSDMVNLTVIVNNSRIQSEEICCLISQCFQVLYTEATMNHIDRLVSSNSSNSLIDVYNKMNCYNKVEIPLMHNNNRGEEDKNVSEMESVYSELSSTKAEFLQNFMAKLQKQLNKDEMQKFAIVMESWQQGGSSFESFCYQIRDLLGPNRMNVLSDMRMFIDSADWVTLDQFIGEQNVGSTSHVLQLSQFGSGGARNAHIMYSAQRSVSFASTSNGAASIYDEEDASPSRTSFDTGSKYKTIAIDNKTDNEFNKVIDSLFNSVGDLEFILSSDR